MTPPSLGALCLIATVAAAVVGSAAAVESVQASSATFAIWSTMALHWEHAAGGGWFAVHVKAVEEALGEIS
ncbi:MAG: hypothetical protein QOF10_4357 [Kribbellaceae bacterium]|jgi:hypothetical protein|nr:hypothetical protein [Kribbellaceae bacterium]